MTHSDTMTPPATLAAIGTPVTCNRYDLKGWICAARENENQIFLMGGGGLEPIKFSYDIIWDNGTLNKDMNETNVNEWIERARHAPATQDELNILLMLADKSAEQRRTARQDAEALARAKRETFENTIAPKIPANAQAVIYAELMVDESDSMTDYFHNRATRTIILAFSAHKRDLFSEMRKAARNHSEVQHLADKDTTTEHREKYSMGDGYYLTGREYIRAGWRIKKRPMGGGALRCNGIPMGEISLAPVIVPAPAQPSSDAAPQKITTGVTIEAHTHTKKGFDMWIVCLADRVERAQYLELLAAAKALGGWYSRKWGNSPAGFAFKCEDAARKFAASLSDDDTPPPSGTRNETAPASVTVPQKTAITRAAVVDLMSCNACYKTIMKADSSCPHCNVSNVTVPQKTASDMPAKLEALAASMQTAIDNKKGSRQTNTPKRRKEAARAYQDACNLERAQAGLRALAVMHIAGDVPPLLAGIKTKKAALELAHERVDYSNAGYYDSGVATGKPSQDTDQARAFWALVLPKSADEISTQKIRALEMKVANSNIDSYFPTPSAVIDDMIDAADIRDNETVLEPSAGCGRIAEAAQQQGAKVTCVEVNGSLCEILRLKGFTAEQRTFEDYSGAAFDKVVMNPPFERGQDIAHVRRAFDMLKPGGRLVSIMSPSYTFNSARKFAEFREWLAQQDHHVTEYEAGTFKESGTMISTVMVTIEKQL